MDKPFDFSQAKKASDVPALARLQQAYAKEQAKAQAIDDDVIAWIESQDSDTKRHINEILRHFMAMKLS